MQVIIIEMIRSSGWMFGGAMLLAGLVALVLCARASWIRTDPARRAALIASITPLVLSFIGVLYGTVLLWHLSQDGLDVADDWPRLGFIVLFGMTISYVPLLWSALLRRGPAVASRP